MISTPRRLADASTSVIATGQAATTHERIPKAIGRYEVERVLGRGGFGVVYLARDSQLDRQVALKVPLRDRFESDVAIEAFVREARNTAQLDHPGIVRVHDVQQESELVYIVQQYVDGTDLASYAAGHDLVPTQAVELQIAIAEAVAYAHEKRIWHLDLKPANILVDTRGQPHVVDFGLALHEGLRHDRMGELAGTTAYMSPEQARGEVHQWDGRADIWSLGISSRPNSVATNVELAEAGQTECSWADKLSAAVSNQNGHRCALEIPLRDSG